MAALVQAADHNFYGTTNLGGADNGGIVFKITPQGALTILHSFASIDGAAPSGSLIQSSDGNFYGHFCRGNQRRRHSVPFVAIQSDASAIHSGDAVPGGGHT
jgi:uncharacterized repeat protein (TIGR03803 family)